MKSRNKANRMAADILAGSTLTAEQQELYARYTAAGSKLKDYFAVLKYLNSRMAELRECLNAPSTARTEIEEFKQRTFRTSWKCKDMEMVDHMAAVKEADGRMCLSITATCDYYGKKTKRTCSFYLSEEAAAAYEAAERADEELVAYACALELFKHGAEFLKEIPPEHINHKDEDEE